MMPFPIPEILRAAQDPVLTGRAINIYAALALNVGDDREIAISYRGLGEKTGNALGQIQHSLNVLQERGYIYRHRPTKRGELTRITVLPLFK